MIQDAVLTLLRGDRHPKMIFLTLMFIMPQGLSGSTLRDVGCGDDCEDPAGVFSGVRRQAAIDGVDGPT